MPIYSVFIGFTIIRDTYKEKVEEFFMLLPQLLQENKQIELESVTLRTAVDIELQINSENDTVLREYINCQLTMHQFQEAWSLFCTTTDRTPSIFPLALTTRCYRDNILPVS